MTYQDTLNHHYEMVSDEVRSLFYILRKRLEQQGIKLLIQGARRHYYMIRHFKQNFRAVKLVLGKRYDYDSAEIINIFDPENDFFTNSYRSGARRVLLTNGLKVL